MLNSFFIILIVINIIVGDLKIIAGIFTVELILNIIMNKTFVKNIKKLKFLIYVYLFTFFIQITSNQEGEVIAKILGIYITKNALVYFFTNFTRVINLVMISWLIKDTGFIFNKLGRYKYIMETVIELVPEVFILFRRRLKFKSFLRYILAHIEIEEK